MQYGKRNLISAAMNVDCPRTKEAVEAYLCNSNGNIIDVAFIQEAHSKKR